ncbi:MAG: TIM-barrel domain-containing protein, partial [Bacteroidota bacterium]
GNYVGHQQTDHGVEIQADNAVVEATCWRAGVIRVRLRKKESDFEGFSYAVVAAPEVVAFEVTEKEDALVLSTETMALHIQKSPVRISFQTKDGKVLNEDDPAFGTSWIGDDVTTYKKMQEGERFVGLGEKTGGLDRRGNAYVNWNTDDFAYETDADPLYLSTPFYIGLHNGQQYGVFFDNSYRTSFNFGASTDRFSSFSAPDGDMDYFLFHADTVAGIVEQYTWLTGRMAMPPKWALGYQQCRYSYYPDTEVLSVARTFREKQIPADVIYLDIHYMQDYKVFTFDGERFSDPGGLCKALKDMGFHVVLLQNYDFRWEASRT